MIPQPSTVAPEHAPADERSGSAQFSDLVRSLSPDPVIRGVNSRRSVDGSSSIAQSTGLAFGLFGDGMNGPGDGGRMPESIWSLRSMTARSGQFRPRPTLRNTRSRRLTLTRS
jgi:hypothetical protein